MGVKDQQLECVLCIQYPVKFKKSSTKIQVLIDPGSKINAMTPVYVAILKLRVCLTNVGAQKIDRSTLLIYYMVLANFQAEDK